jgi:hypothetical protein
MELQMPRPIANLSNVLQENSNPVTIIKKQRNSWQIVKIKVKLFYRKLKPIHWMDGIENFKISMTEFDANKKK